MIALKKDGGFIFYFFLVFLNLWSAWFNIEGLNFTTKPLLLLCLIGVILVTGKKNKLRSIFIAALLFSFIGDVLLLFVKLNSFYFIGGLISFLLAHLAYIIYFNKIKGEAKAKPKLLYIYFVLVALYCISLLIILYPSLGNMKLPVSIYAVVISLMLVISFATYFKVPQGAGKYFVIGAILFVASDSLLALNKFYMSFFQAGFFIMLTYCLAQFCLVKGYINLQDSFVASE